MFLNDLNRLSGLVETALHNANDSQNKVTEIEELNDALYEIEADQEFRICCLEMGMSPEDFDETV